MKIGSRYVDSRDFATAIIFVVVSIIAMAEGYRLALNPLAFRMNQPLKPGMYVAIAGGLLLISGIIYLISLIRGSKTVVTEAKAESGSTAVLIGIVAIVASYGLLITLVGYSVASLLFFIACCWIFGIRKPIPLALWSLGFTFFFVFVFVYLLRVRMPAGMLNLFNF